MIDYQKLGFKCGLEIHQQLEGKKLFCDCPTSNIRQSKADITFKRNLRAVAGETGEVDVAAKFEMEKSKTYIYEGDSKDCCLVDMDEEPPNSINPEAVNAALQVAQLFNAKIVDEIQVMRKTVVDGSNVSGFQRTALVAYDGYIETSKGKVGIPILLLEEEACQPIEKTENTVRYRLDRLGIPLLEIATDASIKDNYHAKEVAEKIGMICRSTGKAKRGIGTIRQDVNVSIEGKNRIEIKGFQEIKTMPKVIENEVNRQLNLKKVEESHVRKLIADNKTEYMRPMPGSARMYPETDVIPLKIDLSNLEDIPELIDKKAERYEELGVNKSLALSLAKSDKSNLFDELVKIYPKIKASFIAEIIFSNLKELQRKQEINISDEQFKSLFQALNEGKISKSVINTILLDIANGKFKSYEHYFTADNKELENEVKKIIAEKPGLSNGAYMGLIMKKFQGKVDGKQVMELLKKNL